MAIHLDLSIFQSTGLSQTSSCWIGSIDLCWLMPVGSYKCKCQCFCIKLWQTIPKYFLVTHEATRDYTGILFVNVHDRERDVTTNAMRMFAVADPGFEVRGAHFLGIRFAPPLERLSWSHYKSLYLDFLGFRIAPPPLVFFFSEATIKVYTFSEATIKVYAWIS